MTNAIMGTDYSIRYAENSPVAGETLADVPPACALDDLLNDPKLNWGVDMQQVFDREGSPIFESRVITRTDTGQHLGLVSKRYEVVQNTKALEFFRPLIDAGATIDCAGVFKGGTSMFVVAKVDTVRPIYPVRGDEIRPYIMFRHGHDGSTGVEIRNFSTRLSCTNMFPLIQRESKDASVRIKHRRGVLDALDILSDATAEALQRFTDSEQYLRRMATTPISPIGLENYFRNVLRLPFRNPKAIVTDDEAYERAMAEGRRKLDWLMQAHAAEEALTPSVAHGTLYHAFNAVTHYVTHDVPTKKSQSRFEKSISGTGAQLSQRAYDRALELAV